MMKRPRTGKKAASRRSAPAARSSRQAAAAPAELDPEAAAYINQLAAALRKVMEAQRRWIPEVDAVSRQQSLAHDAGWRSQVTTAMADLASAAEGLRVQPLPNSMQAVDGALQDAQSQARLAAQGFAEAVERADLRTMLAAAEHIDRMNQLIQRARSLISA
jgi:hypothetical protein